MKTFGQQILIAEHRAAGTQRDNVAKSKKNSRQKGTDSMAAAGPLCYGFLCGQKASVAVSLISTQTLPLSLALSFYSSCVVSFKYNFACLYFSGCTIDRIVLDWSSWAYQSCGNAMWQSWQPLLRVLASDPLCTDYCADTVSPAGSCSRAFSLEQAPECCVFIGSPFSLQALICIFSIKILFSSLCCVYFPSHCISYPIVFSLCVDVETFSNLETFEFHLDCWFPPWLMGHPHLTLVCLREESGTKDTSHPSLITPHLGDSNFTSSLNPRATIALWKQSKHSEEGTSLEHCCQSDFPRPKAFVSYLFFKSACVGSSSSSR